MKTIITLPNKCKETSLLLEVSYTFFPPVVDEFADGHMVTAHEPELYIEHPILYAGTNAVCRCLSMDDLLYIKDKIMRNILVLL